MWPHSNASPKRSQPRCPKTRSLHLRHAVFCDERRCIDCPMEVFGLLDLPAARSSIHEPQESMSQRISGPTHAGNPPSARTVISRLRVEGRNGAFFGRCLTGTLPLDTADRFSMSKTG